MIGKLNRRIKFSVPLQGRDTVYGGEYDTYIESEEVWAGVEFQEVGSNEKHIADQLTARTNAVFSIRYKTGLNTDMRIVYGGLFFEILSLLPDVKRCYMKIETIQLGNLRELSIVQPDGQSLTDASGNSLLFGSGVDQPANYSPPKLIFTDSNGTNFAIQ